MIGILIVAALLAQLATHLPGRLRGGGRARPERQPRWCGSRAIESQWGVFAPNPRSTSLKLEGRVTFEDGSTAVWHLPEGARIGANLRYYRWRKWLERVRSDDFRTLWEPTCQWIASLYDDVRLAGGEGAARAAASTRTGSIGEQPPYEEFVYHTCTPDEPARDGAASAAARMSPWDRFFFRPQSTAPMTLVRIGWGATAAVWAISLLPDIDPFFVKGDLLYERTLSPGAWNVLPHLPDATPGSSCASLLLVASVATMVGLAHAGQLGGRGADDGGAAARQHGDLQLRRPAAAPGRHLRGAGAVRAAVVAGRAARPPARDACATCSARRTACASCS